MFSFVIFLHYREEEISSFRPYYNPDTTSIKAPAGQGCPRCGGAVFAAEQQLAKGTVCHQKSIYRYHFHMTYNLITIHLVFALTLHIWVEGYIIHIAAWSFCQLYWLVQQKGNVPSLNIPYNYII